MFFLSKNGITLSACGVLFGLSGETDSARDILTQMASLCKTSVVFNYDLGIVNASIGEATIAVACFQATIDKHAPPMCFQIYRQRLAFGPFV